MSVVCQMKEFCNIFKFLLTTTLKNQNEKTNRQDFVTFSLPSSL
jgi:hypothetical protein